MPNGVYAKNKCDKDRTNIFIPTEHQTETMNYFLDSKYRGLLLYHRLGSGKTCTSYMISDKMLELGMINHVYVFSPGSLRQNWFSEYCQVCGKNKEFFENNYTFVTYNYASRNIPSLENSLVIIDEVHNLINGVKNESKTQVNMYDKIYYSTCRILALSGTPVINNIHEFSFLGTLLKGKTFFEGDKESFKEECKNGKMKTRLEGIISYYPGKEDSFMPEIIYKPPIKTLMTIKQQLSWSYDMGLEHKFLHPPDERIRNSKKYDFQRQMMIMAKKRILSRKSSNFYFLETRYEDADGNEINIDDGTVKTVDDIKDGSYFRENGGLYNYSPKYCALFINIVLHLHQKQALFTFYKEKAGVNFIKRMLNSCGITAEIFSGDLTDVKRQKLLEKFNCVENRNGELIKILLITEAGAEGISLLETRHFHIVESSTSPTKILQAIGRLARYKSHAKLPEEDRNVTIWRYWSTCKNGLISKKGRLEPDNDMNKCTGIDEQLYLEGEEKLKEYNLFLDILKEVSVTTY